MLGDRGRSFEVEKVSQKGRQEKLDDQRKATQKVCEYVNNHQNTCQFINYYQNVCEYLKIQSHKIELLLILCGFLTFCHIFAGVNKRQLFNTQLLLSSLQICQSAKSFSKYKNIKKTSFVLPKSDEKSEFDFF